MFEEKSEVIDEPIIEETLNVLSGSDGNNEEVSSNQNNDESTTIVEPVVEEQVVEEQVVEEPVVVEPVVEEQAPTPTPTPKSAPVRKVVKRKNTYLM